ncbi:hypothetical protein [Nostoc sp. ChiQUE01b]|uniref:hypothetical protein n=1 Tax=Nostoc sp. ChiQUE01b TaxID=3075376 RepID=UPI002AD31806|nr:hypothetical protein [Nostoc sp. ChiQUE01b]
MKVPSYKEAWIWVEISLYTSNLGLIKISRGHFAIAEKTDDESQNLEDSHRGTVFLRSLY